MATKDFVIFQPDSETKMLASPRGDSRQKYVREHDDSRFAYRITFRVVLRSSSMCSPTETLLRLLLPLNVKARGTSHTVTTSKQVITSPVLRKHNTKGAQSRQLTGTFNRYSWFMRENYKPQSPARTVFTRLPQTHSIQRQKPMFTAHTPSG
ncbi:hypothetical protein ADUPG1_002122 [Aduncisulcus paluster]|uniref:Uncharacterized protein n=1 Tax=Aduncisulcus paluster TaxID=2918883 RepID=A0ABQ5KH67_9EUKA|nr:hypothetical protein ADUPG1_002122 [Aduncisulcus paluster]